MKPPKLRTLYYVGLESYQARYTLQLTDWNVEVFLGGAELKSHPTTQIPGDQIHHKAPLKR